MARYSKGIAALLGAAVTLTGIEMDQQALAQVAALVSAALVYLVPNRA